MSEFKPGEVAVYVGHPDKTRIHSECRPYICEECEVIQKTVHPFYRSVRVYEIRFKDGFEMFTTPEGLRKRRPPEQPAEEWFIEELDKLLKRDREVVV